MAITNAQQAKQMQLVKKRKDGKNDEEWKIKGIPESEIRKDVRVIMPSLDLFGETK